MSHCINKVISKRVWNSEQSWYFETVVELLSSDRCLKKAKVEIRRNAYDDQSYARAYVLGDDKWERIVFKPIQLCHAKEISYTQKDDCKLRNLFELDCNDLLDELDAIIF